MIWKNWPYWLRGGIIGGGVTLIFAILTQFCEYLVVTPGYTGLGLECLPFAIPFIPLWPFNSFLKFSNILFILLACITWFLIGSFIGLLIRYIKLKKKSPPA